MNLPPVLDRRRIRLEIAVILASSLLQLYPGPWLTEQWGKSDIYFFQSADGIIHTHLPFLLCKFNSSQHKSNPHLHPDPENPASPPTRCGYNTPLLSLGIIILELWFNQTIESLPFRKDYLGVGGNETEYTDYNTAQRWQAQTMDEAGIELHNPTRRCIYCAFGAASQSLEDDELRKAVYDDVVQPLERLLQRFQEVWQGSSAVFLLFGMKFCWWLIPACYSSTWFGSTRLITNEIMLLCHDIFKCIYSSI